MIIQISTLARYRLLACAWWLLGPTGCQGDSEASRASADVTPSDSTTAVAPSSSTTVADSSGTGSSGSVFVPSPDLGDGSACDVFAQDCPAGGKCMPWASDAGGSPNATRCVPIADEPAGIGAPCQVDESWYSGVDDCEVGALCWSVDPKTLEGICVPLCLGTESEPYCADPSRFCALAPPLAICLPLCNPLQDDCPDGEVCYWTPGSFQGDWQCGPDVSGDIGDYGDPCAFANQCDPGLVCLGLGALPPEDACEGALGCCTEVCDVFDPAGALQCTGAAGGQECLPFYDDDHEALPGFDRVGGCAVPR